MSAAARKAWRAPHVPGCVTHARPPDCGGAFTCGTCEELVGNCTGAADDYPEDCDKCANKKERRARIAASISLVFTVLLTACGGNFSFVPDQDDGAAGHHLEARHDGSTPEASDETRKQVGADVGPVDGRSDAAPDASDATPEAAPPSDSGCPTLGTTTVTCPYGTPSITAPAELCTTFGGISYVTATPAACQCASTYACPCIVAAGLTSASICGGFAGTCSDTATGPVVTCP